ncbi:MAG: protein-L-isoaspartate(D-aspartate) O-methyltransferase [Bacteroidota bacterium]|jgi:protein-L-isoaspartate(D-aspartate) O-methyltransferase|nr:protein-L-isoaspartate(D-aspartate) O-methyltransferase [Bacteroidota bacterium]
MLQSIPREDTFLHKGLRAKLVDELVKLGIKDAAVIAAIQKIPRHFFLEPGFERYAYENRAFTILANQTISHPYTVAFQTELLAIKKFDKVLEVGTGSAYQTCVLAELGAQVFSIERQKELYDYANHFFYLKKYGTIKRFYGDGFAGLPTYGPFDKIIITAGAPKIPEQLVAQLKIGGIMIIPLGENEQQQMLRLTKLEDGSLQEEHFGSFSFVPMLEGKNDKR